MKKAALLFILILLTAPAEKTFACTTFLMSGKYTSDGKPLLFECFPITYDRGGNYINLSAVINSQDNGYMQMFQPVEEVIFEKAGSLISEIEKGSKTSKDIQPFYAWIDQYLKKTYKDRFDFDLLSD